MAAPTIADLAILPDLEKLAVVDWELARALEAESWTATGSGSYYLAFTDGEVVRVQIDGVELAERFSVATCDAIASTFYYDIANSRLYVHTPDGDSPAAAGPKYSVVAFFF